MLSLAFWVDAEPNDSIFGESLAVWDSQTNLVTNYCVPGIGSGLTPSPVWSPDSRQILVEGYNDKKNTAQVQYIPQSTPAPSSILEKSPICMLLSIAAGRVRAA